MSQLHHSEPTRVRIDPSGRVSVPADLRQQLGILPGQDLILSADDQGIHLQTFGQAVRAAQQALAPYRIAGVSIVDELIEERQAEARRESQKSPPLGE